MKQAYVNKLAERAVLYNQALRDMPYDDARIGIRYKLGKIAISSILRILESELNIGSVTVKVAATVAVTITATSSC